MSRLTVPIFDPPALPVRGMRSALHPSLLAPGEYLGLQNMRWDRGQLEVRPGCASHLDIPTAGATPLQLWSGTLNGATYLVGAFVVAGKIRLYKKSGASWAEITESAGWCGDSAFATNSGRVRMAQFRSPKVVAFGGTLYPAADLLMIQNGEDYPRVWDPAQNTIAAPGLTIHAPLAVPSQAAQFRQVATFKKYLPLASAAGAKAFYTAGVVNAANWKLGDSASTYTGANSVPLWTANTGASPGDVATVRFPTSISFDGEQMIVIMQGLSSPAILTNSKIEISASNVAYNLAADWVTVYDPSSASPWQREYTQVELDASNGCFMFGFKVSHLGASQRGCYQIKFTCAKAPATSSTAFILAICAGGAVEGGSEWGLAYSNQYSRAESPGYVAFSQGADLVKNIGGPNQSTAATLSLVESSDVLFDYNLYIKNSDHASPIVGDIGREPTGADLYLKRPGSEQYYFGFNVVLFAAGMSGPNKAWLKQSSESIVVVNTADATGFDRHLIDSQRPMPSAFNIAVPAARDVLWTNNRLFVLGVKDALLGNYALSDLYFSAERIGTRMQALTTDESLGSRVVFAGEAGTRLISTAAGDQGAAYVYAFTQDNMYSLGGAGAFLGSGFTASSLTRAFRIAPHGTNSPESLVEYRGAIFWVDQDLIVRRYQGGQLKELSRLLIDDRLRSLPSAARRAALAGLVFRDRYYLGYTPIAGSQNTQILIWNEILQAWESDDKLPANVGAERMCRFYDSAAAGSGQRMLMMSAADGKTYEYETGTLDPGSANVAWAVTTREITGSSLGLRPGQPFVIDSVNVLTDALNDLWYVDRFYRIPYCEYRSRLDTNAGWVSDEGKAHQALITEADGKGERGCSAYVNFGSGSPGGTRIMRISLNVEPLANEEAISA